VESTSRIAEFYKKPVAERLKIVAKKVALTDGEQRLLAGLEMMEPATLDRMIENVIGTYPMPFAVALNFLINNRDYLIPMVIEEASVVAGSSNAAKLAREGGGFFTSSNNPLMTGQIQVININDPYSAKMVLLENKEELITLANEQDPVLISFGGGLKDIEVHVLDTKEGPMLDIHLIADMCDAMGANIINTMAEALTARIEDLIKGTVLLRIISNYALLRLARARVTVPADTIGGINVVDNYLKAYAFAYSTPYRAATHNKGIMNGISAVGLATGNDTRALEAGAHSYASKSGCYLPLTTWEKDSNNNLLGTIELPVPVGTVGGSTRSHPVAKLGLKILGIQSAVELSEVIAAVGLCQNMAILRVLVTEGIQKGHMALHAKNIAIMAGASGDEIEVVAEKMIQVGVIRVDRAQSILKQLAR
jgi:hydroxymethylglutaryl-CoA reductase